MVRFPRDRKDPEEPLRRKEDFELEERASFRVEERISPRNQAQARPLLSEIAGYRPMVRFPRNRKDPKEPLRREEDLELEERALLRVEERISLRNRAQAQPLLSGRVSLEEGPREEEASRRATETALGKGVPRGIGDCCSAKDTERARRDALEIAGGKGASLRPGLQRTCKRVIKKGWSKIKWQHDFTALHLAARLGLEDVVNLLIIVSAQPDLEKKDDEGFTPLDYAKEKGHIPVVGLLQEAAKAGILELDTERSLEQEARAEEYKGASQEAELDLGKSARCTYAEGKGPAGKLELDAERSPEQEVHAGKYRGASQGAGFDLGKSAHWAEGSVRPCKRDPIQRFRRTKDHKDKVAPGGRIEKIEKRIRTWADAEMDPASEPERFTEEGAERPTIRDEEAASGSWERIESGIE